MQPNYSTTELNNNIKAVQVENLVKRFGSFTAVDNITFTVSRGEIFGFLGPNGAGKSTTIRILCGLLKPSDGKAVIGGYDVSVNPEGVKHSIGYMSQRFSLYDDLTVEENLRFFSGVYGVPENLRKERKAQIIKMAGLSERKNTLARHLSGGWKQRLALGCAIMHQPPTLFLDEPTSGVDPIARREFWDLIYQLSEKGHTIFVTTHYMDEAEYCHRLALMYAGKIIAMGTPSSLKKAFSGYSFLRLDSPSPFESMKAIEGHEGIMDVAVFGSGLHVRVKNSKKAIAAITLLLQEKGIRMDKLEPVYPSMEDIFVGMIEEREQNIR